MSDVSREAAPSSHTAFRSGVAGTVASSLSAIAVYFAKTVTPEGIQTEVNTLITIAVGFVVAAAIGFLGSWLRDLQAQVEVSKGEEPKASTLRVPI
jgi:hypothetical protein